MAEGFEKATARERDNPTKEEDLPSKRIKKEEMSTSGADHDLSVLQDLWPTPYYMLRILPNLNSDEPYTRVIDRAVWISKIRDLPLPSLCWKLDLATSLIGHREATKGATLSLQELEECLFDVQGWARSLAEDWKQRKRPDSPRTICLANSVLEKHLPKTDNQKFILSKFLKMKTYNHTDFLRIMRNQKK